ncbi:MAG: hypothetical protein LBT09_04410 [Planctomycetaceae bacterium]|jgi:hypothetical protein|nr:hypothetical protein [Planctomycetaceae bacterium]
MITRTLFIAAILLIPQLLPAQSDSLAQKKPAISTHRELITNYKQELNTGNSTWRPILYNKLTISPQKLDTPLLKYRINTFPSETEYENAYTFYCDAIKTYNELRTRALSHVWKSEEYNSAYTKNNLEKQSQLEYNAFPPHATYVSHEKLIPVDAETEKQIYKTLNKVYVLLEKGSRCRIYNWAEFNEVNGIATVFQFAVDARMLAGYLRFKADWEIRNGNFTDAIQTIRVGLALGNHIKSATPQSSLVELLVGIAIENMMTTQLFHLVSQPDAPNLFPALTIYNSKANLTNTINAEQIMTFSMLKINPAVLHDINKATSEECKNLLHESLSAIASLSDNFDPNDDREKKPTKETTISRMSFAVCTLSYLPAKERLLKRGLSEEQIESLSVYQIIVPYLYEHIQNAYDFARVNASLPIWESHPAIKFNEETFVNKLDYSNLADVWISLMFPAISAARSAVQREKQTIDRLKIVEAIRYYASVHDGKLPETLDAIKELPVPKNCPVTGKPYEYKLEGNKITIDFDIYYRTYENNKTRPNSRMEIILEPTQK